MQARRLVRQVDGLPATEGLILQGAAGLDERGDVGNGVKDPVAPVTSLYAHRLVQVHGPLWVDGHQRDIASVAALRDIAILRSLGLIEDLLAEVGGNRELLGNRAEV